MVTKNVICKLTYATFIQKLNLERKKLRHKDTKTCKNVDT